jgi:hypothetical protein
MSRNPTEQPGQTTTISQVLYSPSRNGDASIDLLVDRSTKLL